MAACATEIAARGRVKVETFNTGSVFGEVSATWVSVAGMVGAIGARRVAGTIPM